MPLWLPARADICQYILLPIIIYSCISLSVYIYIYVHITYTRVSTYLSIYLDRINRISSNRLSRLAVSSKRLALLELWCEGGAPPRGVHGAPSTRNVAGWSQPGNPDRVFDPGVQSGCPTQVTNSGVQPGCHTV